MYFSILQKKKKSEEEKKKKKKKRKITVWFLLRVKGTKNLSIVKQLPLVFLWQRDEGEKQQNIEHLLAITQSHTLKQTPEPWRVSSHN